jgi:TatD DNase family protein
MIFADSHCHLDCFSNLTEYFEKARGKNIIAFLAVGASKGVESNLKALEIASQFKNVYASVGIHPHEASKHSDLSQLAALFVHPKLVAVGETGLDFHYQLSPPKDQIKMFELHIYEAIRLNRPIIIHCREAYSAAVDILRNFKELKGVFHCFTGGKEDVKAVLALENFYISASGVITFKKAENLRFAIRKVPLDRILIETDAPYLAPAPYRGKTCESWMLVETAKVLSGVLGVQLEALAEATVKNFEELFNVALEI